MVSNQNSQILPAVVLLPRPCYRAGSFSTGLFKRWFGNTIDTDHLCTIKNQQYHLNAPTIVGVIYPLLLTSVFYWVPSLTLHGNARLLYRHRANLLSDG